MLQQATTKNTSIYIYIFKEARQNAAIYGVMIADFRLSSIN